MTIAPRGLRSYRAGRAVAALAACVASLSLTAAGCGSDDGPKGNTPAEKGGADTGAAAKEAVTVNIADFKFNPKSVKVKTGGTVTFVNKDKAPHTAQTDLNPKAAEFDTERLTTGDEKAVKVAKAGKFAYFCVYHRFMEGTVEVVE